MMSRFLFSLFFVGLLSSQESNGQLCSWALGDFLSLPVVIDECNYVNNLGFEANCEDDVAIFSFYEASVDCTGNPINTTYALAYDCSGETGDDCDQLRVNLDFYNTSSDCTGTAAVSGEWYNPVVDDLCINITYDFGVVTTVSYDFDLSTDGEYLIFYLNGGCVGTPAGSTSFVPGCEMNETLIESLYVEIEEVDNDDSSGSTDSSSTDGGNGTTNGNGTASADSKDAGNTILVGVTGVISILMSFVFAL